MNETPLFPPNRILYPAMFTGLLPRLTTSIQSMTSVETSLIFSPAWAQRQAGKRYRASTESDLFVIGDPTSKNWTGMPSDIQRRIVPDPLPGKKPKPGGAVRESRPPFAVAPLSLTIRTGDGPEPGSQPSERKAS